MRESEPNRPTEPGTEVEYFSASDVRTDADRVLEAASRDGRAVVVGEDGQPDVIISVSKRELEL